MKEVRSPISSRKGTEGLPTSPGARATQNYHPKADAGGMTGGGVFGGLPDINKITQGTNPPPDSGKRSDGGLTPGEHHLARHRLLQLGRDDR
jgi:hypothetical protein